MVNQHSSMYNLASAIYSPQIVDAKQVGGHGRWHYIAYAFYYQLVRAAMLVKSDIFLHVRQSVRIERIRLFIRLSDVAKMSCRTMNVRCHFLLMMTLNHALQCNDIFVNETARSVETTRVFNEVRHVSRACGKQLIVHQRIRPNPNEASLTTAEIIAGRGYPVEIHSVTTSDGYILELHRIPYGKGQKMASTASRRPVFLQHGILTTDNVWLINQNGLGFVLADAGYDVWMGNARGNTYSRRHVKLDPSKEEYWNFSFDEMGNYDIPAVINFVLAKTGSQKISYIGHSMGCTMFFICMSLHPELNEKIDVMIALAPAVSMAESTAPLAVYQAPFAEQIKFVFDLIGVRAYEPVDTFCNNLRKQYCGPNLFLRYSLCRNTIFSSSDDEYHAFDLNILPIIDGHNPAGTSVKTAVHYAQNYMTGQTFQRYDFGHRENLLRYGQTTPPTYDLSKVTCNVFIFWGQRDKVSAPKDIAWLANKLGNLKASIMIEDPLWNHLSFLFSSDAKRLVYDKLIPLLPLPTS
ncbi:lipase member K isoform X1 [Daphnia magna]|uniref:lipase member K isoform X1 n=2 Tax=Daphnia magna TaxID=35525 RepID=UPI001E1BB003|nr:lipase member K isoform X1 [Daphnia magna]